MGEDTLQAALDAAARSQRAELERLLSERDQLGAWSAMSAPEAAQRVIAEQLAALDAQIVELLVVFHRAGGSIELAAPARPAPGAPPITASAPPDDLPAIPVVPKRAPTPVAIASNRPTDSGEFDAPSTARRRVVRTGPTATREDLERLKSAASTGELHAPPPQAAIWRPAFVRLMTRLGPGADLQAELDRVTAAGKGCEAWKGWPRHVQKHLVGHVACRLRALQDEHGVPDVELQDAFSALTRFSKREQPGFVFGLSRNHRPQHGPSWDDDAERHWDQLSALLPDGIEETPNQEKCLEKLGFLIPEIERAPNDEVRKLVTGQAVRAVAAALDAGVDSRDPRLVKLAAPVAEHLDGRVFRRLRRAIRDAESPDDDTDNADVAVPDDWRWWQWTRGRRGVIVGGSPREHARKRLEAAFEFAELEWVGAENAKRGLQSLRNRVAAGSVDTLLMLGRFIGHDADDILLPAAREADTAWVHVDHGYGVNRVRSAIERFLEPEGEPSL